MLPSLVELAPAALGAGGLALDGPPSVPTQAKRDADGLAVDARTFLVDARGILASVEREVVFEPELAEEARTLIERGAQLATNREKNTWPALAFRHARKCLRACPIKNI